MLTDRRAYGMVGIHNKGETEMIVTFHMTPHWTYQGTVSEMPDHIYKAYLNRVLGEAFERVMG